MSLAAKLAQIIDGEVDDSTRVRAEYSTDASNYRVVPTLVAFPKRAEDVVAAQAFAAEEGIPLTVRGGGTSIAGNSIGPGIILDLSRHYNQLIDLDPQARTAKVQPGLVLSTLQKAAAPHGLRFGPDPSTSTRATLGGMIGNNACGPHAVAWGKTAENTISLDVVDGMGRTYQAGPGVSVPGLSSLVSGNLADIRTHFGTFSRHVSGYSLEHLLPENGADLAKFLVGSEGSLATVLEAEVGLVPLCAAPTLVVFGYRDMIEAADAVPGLLACRPMALEGLDRKLVDMVERAKGSVPDLPPGGGWLMVEVGAFEGENDDIVAERIEAMKAVARTEHVSVCPAGPKAKALWQIRADGAGLGGRTARGGEGWPGWEDSAVPPAKLGAYVRDLDEIMTAHDVDGILYGHFGDGCLHVRFDFPLEDEAGVARTRSFLEDCARALASYGGSISGEHGDGRARSEFLATMYPPAMVELMAKVKDLFDPDRNLNPGIIADAVRFDENLRRPASKKIMADGGFAFAEDGGDLTRALHRCTGVGNCRADRRADGFYMCPSYQATKDEKDVTRGRMRVLEEVTNGSLIADWGSHEVLQSLDLCLSCKACSVDCPTGIDVAKFKSEALFRAYRGKIRPKLHYLLGQLPRWTRMATAVPAVARLTNAIMSIDPIRKAAFTLAGIDTRRFMPALATERFRSSSGLSSTPTTPKYVLLWADTFSETLDGQGARDAVRVLQDAGYEVVLPPDDACCGLTWITTGQLTGAKAQLSRLVSTLAPFAANSIPIIGIEPSCTAVLRSDLTELLPDDPRAGMIAEGTLTLAEFLTSIDYVPPSLSRTQVVAQPHCHHYSVMGWNADRELLAKAGADVIELAGCCGLAGNFGMEAGHAEISEKIANQALLPALDEHPDAVYLADGFSCRTQAATYRNRGGVHLATLLARGLDSGEESTR